MKKLIIALAVALTSVGCDARTTFMGKVPIPNDEQVTVSKVTSFDGITLYKVDIHGGPDVYVAAQNNALSAIKVTSDDDGYIREEVATVRLRQGQ